MKTKVTKIENRKSGYKTSIIPRFIKMFMPKAWVDDLSYDEENDEYHVRFKDDKCRVDFAFNSDGDIFSYTRVKFEYKRLDGIYFYILNNRTTNKRYIRQSKIYW